MLIGIACLIYSLIMVFSLAHAIWYFFKFSSWLHQSARVENVKDLRSLIEKEINYYFKQSTLGFLILFLIASLNTWIVIQQVPFTPIINRIIRFFFGLSVNEGFFSRLGFLGLYWGLIIIVSVMSGMKARGQLKLLWVLRKELQLEMPRYHVEKKTVGVPVLIIFIIILILLLAFLLFFPHFI